MPRVAARKRAPRRRLAAAGIAGIVLLVAASGLAAALLWPVLMGSAPEPAGSAGPNEATIAAAPETSAARSDADGSVADGSAAVGDVESLRLSAPEPAAGESDAGADGAPAATGVVDGSGTAAAPLPAAPGTRLFVHYGNEAGSEEIASSLYTELSREGGYPVVVLREVAYTIATPRVRYFHAGDAAAAERLTAFLATASTNGEVWQLQNFTSYRPQPTPGTIEIYVPPG